MNEAGKGGQTQVCPQCDRHCPADTLQCGRGCKYLGVTGDSRDGCDHDHSGHHGRICRGPRQDRDDLAGKFERCGRLLSHLLGKRRGQGRILRTLCQRGEMPQKELQDLLGIQAGSMSEIAAKLEDKGLIVRVRSGEDRRKVYLSITEQGRARVAKTSEEHILRRRAELFSALTPEERGTLEGLLDKLSADWDKRLEDGGRTDLRRCR